MFEITNGIRHETIEFPQRRLLDNTTFVPTEEFNQEINFIYEFFGEKAAQSELLDYCRQEMEDAMDDLKEYEEAINKIIDDSYKQKILFHEDQGDTRWKGKKKAHFKNKCSCAQRIYHCCSSKTLKKQKKRFEYDRLSPDQD